MNITFSRRLVVALIVVLTAGFIFRASYFQENSEAYLFPNIIAGSMLVLSLISLMREAFDLCVDDFQPFPFPRQLPVILIMGITVFLVEVLGIFVTSFLALTVISFWYSPEEDQQRRIIRSLVFSAGFTAFMYVLFSLMLNVQLPRGLLI